MLLYRLDELMLLAVIILFPVLMLCCEAIIIHINTNRITLLLKLLFIIISFSIILYYCVMGRPRSNIHIFTFWGNSFSSNDFVKEMELNILLYEPLGESMMLLLKKYYLVIIVSLGVSFLIEFWQFYYGAGTGQVTDIICNIIGSVVGVSISGFAKKILLRNDLLHIEG